MFKPSYKYEQINGNHYVSVNMFKGRRESKNLFALTNFFVDLDIYNTHLIHLDDYKEDKYTFIVESIKEICIYNNLPMPSRVIYTGRGFQLLYNIKGRGDYVGSHPAFKNAYKLVNKKLAEMFGELGADIKATDVSRLRRLEGTINKKSGQMAEEVYNNKKSYTFEQIADRCLKHTYTDVYEWKMPTAKQLDNARKYGINAGNMDRFKLGQAIAEDYTEKNKATEEQIKVICKYTGLAKNEAKELSKLEASNIIKISIKKRNNNNTYLFDVLAQAYHNGQIKEGNRSVFFYLLGLSFKMRGLNIDNALNQANEYNKVLKLSEKELKNAIEQGLNNSNADYISYKVAGQMLGIKWIEEKKAVKWLEKTRKRATKKKVIKVLGKSKKSLKTHKNTSIRDIADIYGLSVGESHRIKLKNIQEIEKKARNINAKKIAEEYNVKLETAIKIVKYIKKALKEYIKTKKEEISEHINQVHAVETIRTE